MKLPPKENWCGHFVPYNSEAALVLLNAVISSLYRYKRAKLNASAFFEMN